MKIINFIRQYSTRIILALFVVLFLGVFAYFESTKISLKGYEQIYQETFDQSSLSSEWLLIDDGSFHYTGFYDNDQVKIGDGKLTISLVRKDGDAGNQLYASAIRSQATYTYGYFEVTAILPKVNEINAVIALSNDEALINTDPTQGAKIVFASSNNQPYPLLATGVYYDNTQVEAETQNAFVLSLVYGESHRYGVLWDETGYAFYFDGYLLWESEATPTSEKPLYLTFGFEFPYYSNQDLSKLSADFIIKEVKIYQEKP